MIYFNQESFLFSPTRKANAESWDFSTPYSERWFPCEKDSLNAVVMKTDSARGTILFFHGNGGNLQSPKGLQEFFSEQQFRFAVYDYPGFGKSSGSIQNQQQLCESGERFWKEITRHFPGPYIICGYSIGSGIAAEVAKNHADSLYKLILLAPYADLSELAGQKVPFYPKWLMSYTIKPAETLQNFTKPVLLVHGMADGMIPKSNSIILHKIIPVSTLCVIDSCKHAGFERYDSFRKSVAAFLR